jgi:hypothetical protein
MSTKPRNNQAARTLTFTKILAGITQHVTTAIILGGASTTEAALSAIFQAALQAQQDLDAAHAALSAKVQAHKAALAAAAASEVLLHKWAEATFGPESGVLSDFGFVPAKPAEKSSAVKAGSAAKASATRKAKKAAVLAVTEPTAAPEPASPSPAPAAPAKS